MTIFLSIVGYIVMGVITTALFRLHDNDFDEESDTAHVMVGLTWPIVFPFVIVFWVYTAFNKGTILLAKAIKAAIDRRRIRKQGENCIIDL